MVVLSTLSDDSFDRAIVPRPKEGGRDGDMSTSLCGLPYLKALLPKLRSRGEVHWYDFASDAELEGGLARTKASIRDAVQAEGMEVEFLHAGKAGSGTIAKRQYRVCVDFRVVK